MDFGERLKEERGRLGMSQTQFAAVAGVGKTTQINYESGSRAPDVTYLAAVAKIGADVQYIVTGVRSTTALTQDEIDLLEHFRAAPIAVRAAAIGGLTAGTSSAIATAPKEQVFQKKVGQHIKVSGNLDQSGISFFGRGKKKK